MPAAAGSEMIASGFVSASRMMSSSGRKRFTTFASIRPSSPAARSFSSTDSREDSTLLSSGTSREDS